MDKQIIHKEKADSTLADDYWRFERKFYIQDHSLHEIENEILRHPAVFRKIHHVRQVNNIYFDTHGMQAFVDNIEGVPKRKKSRVRWYGETFGPVEKAKLEYKIKQGFLGRKEHFTVAPFTMDAETGTTNLLKALDTSNLPVWVKSELSQLNPKLLNCYKRKYYLSGDGKFRLTVDTDMRFMQPDSIHHGFNWHKVDQGNAVMELKYFGTEINDKEARNVASAFKFRMTKNSKYCNGIEFLYFVSY